MTNYYFLILCMLLAVSIGTGAIAAEVFEADFNKMQDWTISERSLVNTEPGASGSSILKISSNPAAAEGSESTAAYRLLPMSKFDPKGEYRLQFRAKSDHFPQEYMVYLGIMQGQQMPVVIGYEWRQVGTNWQDVSLDFTDMNPVATDVRLVLQVKAKGSVWFEDLKIVKLPEGSIVNEDSQLKDLPKFKGSKDFVQITPTRRFLVKNKPFFPIGLWGIDFPNEKAMQDMQSFGINVTGTGHLIGRKAEGTKEFLDMAQSYGLMVAGVLRFNISGDTEKALAEAESYKQGFKPIIDIITKHPAFFAYDIADEPAWAGNNLAAFSSGAHFIRENDPNHPIFSNQAPRQSINLFKRWYRFVDIGGSDIYPYWNGEPDKHSDLPVKTLAVVGEETKKNLTAIGPGKPVIMTIQGFGWSDGTTDPGTKASGYAYPPQLELRFMAYDAITSGASGIMFFQDQRYSVIDPRVKTVSLELSALHDVLAAVTEAKGAVSYDKRVNVMTKTLGKDMFVIAVNTTDSDVQAKIKLPGDRKNWTLLFEKGDIVSKAGEATVTLKPWDVNIYTNSLDKAMLRKIEKLAATER